ncbi:MAG: hypothetical protein A2Z20_06505 [Bdellovibrionales bacterium RBG_16_40_8]|nr:MAG: hypothetical protein A2Z20_06505 [Bdellovibrionales bacterium RBG_16_40_8]
MKKIFSILLIFSTPQHVFSSQIEEEWLQPNESIIMQNGRHLVRLTCKSDVIKLPYLDENRCKIEPVWQNAEFVGFYVILDDNIWQKFMLSDYGHHRQIAYRAARRELATMENDGLCN